jgi:isoleucyl-tRNA synthetase
MSKHLGNVLDPMATMDEFGADAVRWFFYSAVNPGQDYRLGPTTLRSVVRTFVLTLWNTYRFFCDYAAVDGFDPADPTPPPSERPVLDRWVLARLAQTVSDVRRSLDEYDAPDATHALESLVDDVSKWYVRRSRDRFWRGGDAAGAPADPAADADKAAAHATLYTVLLTLSQLLAPFMPFLSERMYRNLAGFDGDVAPPPSTALSVHLTDYPQADTSLLDADLLAGMARLRRLVEDGLAARETAKIKVRQPLRSATVFGDALDAELEAVFAEELNVRAVNYAPRRGEHDAVELDTEVDDELRLEGVARELSRAVNALRKQAALDLSDRIVLRVDPAAGGDVARSLAAHGAWLAQQTLCVDLLVVDPDGDAEWTASATATVAGERVGLALRRA